MRPAFLAASLLALLAGCAQSPDASLDGSGPKASIVTDSHDKPPAQAPSTSAASPASSPSSPAAPTTSPAPASSAPASSAPSPPPSTSAASPTKRPAKTWDVDIRGNDFVDGSLTVQAGDTVVWHHKDGVTPHSVTARDGSYDSGAGLPCPGAGCMVQVQGKDTYTRVFDKPGASEYFCKVHPSMVDTITVVAAAGEQ